MENLLFFHTEIAKYGFKIDEIFLADFGFIFIGISTALSTASMPAGKALS